MISANTIILHRAIFSMCIEVKFSKLTMVRVLSFSRWEDHISISYKTGHVMYHSLQNSCSNIMSHTQVPVTNHTIKRIMLCKTTVNTVLKVFNIIVDFPRSVPVETTMSPLAQ